MNKRTSKILSIILSLVLLFQQSGFAQIAAELNIAGHLSAFRNSFVVDKFRPVHLRYLQYLPKTSNFKLFLDKGDEFSQDKLGNTSKELLNYFYIGLTLPNDSFWVNLRPDAEDNIIDEYLSKTDIGKIMLETDLQLKKDTANFTSPQTPEGKAYWDKLYKKAAELYGYDNVTIPTLTRPWIVPGEIIVRESQDSAYIYKATLKVMLEQDYLKNSTTYNFQDERSKVLNEYSSELIRELIIPKLTKEVNSSKRYAPLRQVYYSLILAQWFKARHKQPLIDSRDLTNLISKEAWSKTTYFQAYQKSFKEGEYKIQEPVYTPTGQVIRSYFSGGENFNNIASSSMVVIPATQAVPLAANKLIEMPPAVSSPLEADPAAEPIKGSHSITFDKSYVDKVATMEGLMEFRYYLQDSLKDQNFVRDTINKLGLVSKDTHIIGVEIEQLHEKSKIVFLITLKDRDGSSLQFVIYYIHTFSAKGYERAEDEMRKDPSLKIFPKVGIVNDPGLNRVLLSVEYIKPLSAEETGRFTSSQKSIALITAVFTMLNKKLYLRDDLFLYKQYAFAIGANGKLEAKILDLDSLDSALPADIINEVAKTFEYAKEHRVDIEPKDRILDAVEMGSKYIESTYLIAGYASFMVNHPYPWFSKIEEIKEKLRQLKANSAAGEPVSEAKTTSSAVEGLIKRSSKGPDSTILWGILGPSEKKRAQERLASLKTRLTDLKLKNYILDKIEAIYVTGSYLFKDNPSDIDLFIVGKNGLWPKLCLPLFSAYINDEMTMFSGEHPLGISYMDRIKSVDNAKFWLTGSLLFGKDVSNQPSDEELREFIYEYIKNKHPKGSYLAQVLLTLDKIQKDFILGLGLNNENVSIMLNNNDKRPDYSQIIDKIYGYLSKSSVGSPLAQQPAASSAVENKKLKSLAELPRLNTYFFIEAGKLMDQVGVKSGQNVLEVGPASDVNAVEVAKRGAHYRAYSLNDQQFDRQEYVFGKYDMSTYGGSATVKKGEFSSGKNSASKDIADRSQDLVFILSGALSDPFPESDSKEVFREALRVIKPGGKIVLGTEGIWVYEKTKAHDTINRVLNEPEWRDKVRLELMFEVRLELMFGDGQIETWQIIYHNKGNSSNKTSSPLGADPAAGSTVSSNLIKLRDKIEGLGGKIEIVKLRIFKDYSLDYYNKIIELDLNDFFKKSQELERYQELRKEILLFANALFSKVGVADRENMCFAINESIQNAFIHGNKANPSYPIFIRLNINENNRLLSAEIYNALLDESDVKVLEKARKANLFGYGEGEKSIRKVVGFKREKLKDEAGRIMGAKVTLVPSASSSIADKGGIDFRALPIVTQAMSNLRMSLKAGDTFRQSYSEALKRKVSPDLNGEWQEIERLASSGITPSSERIKEFLQASCAKGDILGDKDKVILCIADILRSEEEDYRATDPALRDILVVLETSSSSADLSRIFLG